MAESKNNYVMYGMSGKLGKLLIFRQRAGKTFAMAVPNRSASFTEEQLEIQSKFKEAASWARGILKNAENRKFYSSQATGGQSAFNMAIADWFTDPEIKEIDTTDYTGVTGSVIKVLVADIIKVQSVKVSITTASGTLVEEGSAVFDADSQQWLYVAIQNNASPAGSIIKVTATDKPGNSHSLEKVV
jgi:phosphoketolase